MIDGSITFLGIGGGGGGTYGIAGLSTIYFGGGGGAGGGGWYGYGYCTGGRTGGTGGGIIMISADTINVSGAIQATGGAGTPGSKTACVYAHSSGGGGGAGGSIKLVGNDIALGTDIVTATGGAGGSLASPAYGWASPGGAGGNGRIRVEYTNSLSGSTNPVVNSTQVTNDALNDTATYTSSPIDHSDDDSIIFWVRSDRTGQFMRFQMGESDSSEQTYDITINSANTWEQKTWDISGISDTDIDAITKYAFKVTNIDSDFNFYFDNIISNSSCGPTLGESNHYIMKDCSFGGYIDADDATETRIVTGLDVGISTSNSSVLYVQGGTLTISANETMVVGSIELSSGSIAIADGGVILVGGSLWAVDADSDTYPAETQYYAKAEGQSVTNGVRLNTISSNISLYDCDDSDELITWGSTPYYRDLDGDTYGNSGNNTLACDTPPTGYVSDDTDCYDADPASTNAELAYPGSSECNSSNRGDGSFDYDCDTSETKCGTEMIYEGSTTHTGAWYDLGSCGMCNSRCSQSFTNVYVEAGVACGQAGGSACTSHCSGCVGGDCDCVPCGDCDSCSSFGRSDGCIEITPGTQACQ